ncbi:DotU family type VI secretion system protein [Variovorax sp. CAN2819]|uniref:DotU family type VI secretion system protein n=1 Tax=Variovorax sp. CAN15 TaxID=3046727 RepID=UPI002647D8C9|nr:DotU family type VI secretion system protein [Variovorax sp. CAN15]MDN6883849.1 DotU family type VI secretion system protein [Variovorax sp. CAN15]
MNGVNDMAVGPGGFVPPNPGGGNANGGMGGMPPASRGAGMGGGLGAQPDSFTAWHDARRPHAGDTALAGNNPLVAAANPLLDLIPQIRATGHHPAPSQLREHLVDEVRRFETRAQQAGISPEVIIGARYCLCTAVDEAAALTPWGGSIWSSQSLLVMFHNETWGGEKFFQLLSRLVQNPQQHLHLIELIYFCLAMGFEGRFRVIDNGRSQLETLKQRLLQIIRQTRGEIPMPLSPHWQDGSAPVRRSRNWLPVWAVGAVAAVLLVAVFAFLTFNLAGHSDGAFAAVNAVRLPQAERAVVMPAPVPRLQRFLEPEIREGLLTVRDEADRSVVVLRGDGLFASGSDRVLDRYAPVLTRVADALNSVEGNVLVSGFSDDQPIRSVRFPSNWQLSQARADAVKKMIAARLARPERLRAEGRGDADPLVPNDSPANRARNRRVEVTLLVAPVAPAPLAVPAPAPAPRPGGTR